MGFGAGQARAMGAKRLESLKAIRDFAGALVSEEEFKAWREENDKLRDEFMDLAMRHYKRRQSVFRIRRVHGCRGGISGRK